MQTFTPILKKHVLPCYASGKKSYTWTVFNTIPFDELLLSWNALRPHKGHYVILCSLYHRNQWSPWLLNAVWGVEHQYSFHDRNHLAPVRTFQDQIEVLDNEIATGFKVRIEACGGASLDSFYAIFGCMSRLNVPKHMESTPLISTPCIPLLGLSQIRLEHPRSTSMCSPTSTTAVIRYLKRENRLCPLKFSKNIYDSGFDLYGNWSFNVAQAFTELGKPWKCFCARVSGFEFIMKYLMHHLPVIVSLKGSLPGALKEYQQGHLVVIKGYNALDKQIHCIDPAFFSDGETVISYPWEDFIKAWNQRGNIGYFFNSKNF